MKISLTAAAFALLIGACGARSHAVPAGDRPTQASDAQHVVYLHGKIVQEHGKNAVSPEFGPYLFDEIVTALARDGARVHAPVRTGTANTEESAKQVETLVRELLASGVPASRLTIVGASMGAVIAIRVSASMKNPSLRFVLLGACNDWVRDELKPDLHGHVLSIYEEGDPYGASCASVADGKPGIAAFEEVRLTTGLSHGFLYRPLPVWVDPTLRWFARPVPEAGAGRPD